MRSRHGCPNRLTPAQYCKLFKKSRRRRRSKSRKRQCKCTIKRRPGGRSRSRRRSIRRIRRRTRRRSRRSTRRRSRRRRSRSRGKCGRPGPKTKNPFLNFMRVFRRKKCGWPARKIAIQGAKRWCKMGDKQKIRFYREACVLRKKKRGRSRGRRRSRRGRSKRGGSRRRRARC